MDIIKPVLRKKTEYFILKLTISFVCAPGVFEAMI
jgi:hypothetical protein